MTRTDLAALAARLATAPLFLSAAVDKVQDVPGLESFLAQGGLPSLLAWPTIAFELALGLALLTGFRLRLAAVAGAAFCTTTAILFHFDLGDWLERTMFLKNLAIAGGLLALAQLGPGRFSIAR
jgi:putative oxidoreductase